MKTDLTNLFRSFAPDTLLCHNFELDDGAAEPITICFSQHA